MPQIGWLEILIIVSIAIIVVGPKDFPLMLKKMGSWIGSIKRYVSDVQNQVSEGRVRYKFYRDRGYPLQHHQLNQWED